MCSRPRATLAICIDRRAMVSPMAFTSMTAEAPSSRERSIDSQSRESGSQMQIAKLGSRKRTTMAAEHGCTASLIRRDPCHRCLHGGVQFEARMSAAPTASPPWLPAPLFAQPAQCIIAAVRSHVEPTTHKKVRRLLQRGLHPCHPRGICLSGRPRCWNQYHCLSWLTAALQRPPRHARRSLGHK